MKKDLHDFVKTLLKSGQWVLKEGSHFKLIHIESGKMVVTSKTPSDKRSILNFRAMIRKTSQGSI